MNAADARAYANQWDGAYIASFEPQDIASLKQMYDIVKAVGGATKDPPDSAFDPGPYTRSEADQVTLALSFVLPVVPKLEAIISLMLLRS